MKIRYTCVKELLTFNKTFTIEEIENGEAKIWMDRNYTSSGVLHRDRYTGLLDKNGEEVYEGDVLKVNYSGHWMKEVVIYEYGAFKKRYHEESGEIHNLHFTSLSPNNIEVIGNIYEHPSLLTQ